VIFEKGENMKFKKTLTIFVILIIGLGITGIATAVSFNEDANSELKVWFKPIFEWYKKPITGDVSISTDKGNYDYGDQVDIVIKNSGDDIAYIYGAPPIWSVEKRQMDGSWELVSPKIVLCVYLNLSLEPGEIEKTSWEVDSSPGDYRVTVSYYVKEPKYKFTEYCYFSVSSLYIIPIIDKPEVKPIDPPESIEIEPIKAIPVDPPEAIPVKVDVEEIPILGSIKIDSHQYRIVK
jgi:hypothetical protein